MILSGSLAHADGLINCTGPDGQCELCDLFNLINNIVAMVIKVIVPSVAALLIAYAGFKMLMNQGNSEVTNQVKQIIFGTVIGIVVVYTSYALVGLMLNSMGYVQYSKNGNKVVDPLNWAPKCQN